MLKTKRILALVLTVAIVASMAMVISPGSYANVYEGNPVISRRAATEGMVLLENTGGLPLAAGAKVALFGRTQITYVKGGTGSGETTVPYTINVLQGMQNKQAVEKIVLNSDLAAIYTTWVAANPGNANNTSNPEMALTEEIVNAARAQSDVAVVVIGRNSGEGSDRRNSKGNYLLKDDETDMLAKVSAAFDKIVVVLNIGGVIDMKWLSDYPNIKAVLLAWQPGMEGGNAIADVLCGDVNPSGKLTDTFAINYADYASSANFPQSGSSSRVTYVEDIYNGYRYFATADPTYSKVKYEFGYGLSYSNFETSFLGTTAEVKDLSDAISVKAIVKNNGPYPGKEVIQVYAEAPNGNINKPARVLVGFAKTKLLAVGESQTLDIMVKGSDIASYDDSGITGHKSAWILEPGSYRLYVGNSIKNAAFYGTYEQTKLRVVEQLTEQLSPVMSFDRLVDPVTGAKSPVFILPPIEVSGMTTFSATNFASATSAVRIETIPGTTERCIAFFNLNEEVTYKLNVDRAGTYDFSFDYALGRAAIADTFDCYVNDVKQDIVIAMTQTGDGDGKSEWYNFITSPTYQIELPEGNVTLRWKSKSSAGNISNVRLANITSPNPPSGGGSGGGGSSAPEVVIADANEKTKIELEMPESLDNYDVSDLVVLEQKKDSIFPAPPELQFHDVYLDPTKMDDFIAAMTIADLAYLSQGHGATIGAGTGTIGNYPQLGISPVDTADGPAGLRLNSTATAWPVSTLLACTWDIALMEEIGNAIGNEAIISSVDVWLAPGMNIHRNPLCGRNFEYLSEDPFLTGKIAAAITKGVQSKGIGVTLKHYAANNQETNRSGVDTIVSERALREIYLKGFEIAVKEAKPWCIMTSYNLINGAETAERYDLVTTVLRDEWGFDGLVMTDWSNNSAHWKEAIAGNDVKMPSGETASLLSAVEGGTLQRWELERNVKRVLELVLKSRKYVDYYSKNPITFEAPIINIAGEGTTRVEAERAAEISGAPQTEACTDVGGGYNMGYMDAGGKITYYFDVAKSGVYNLVFRYAANSSPNGGYNILVDNDVVAQQPRFTSTGGWQNWRTSTTPLSIPLTAGEHFFTISITGGGSNLNWFELTYDKPLPAQITGISATTYIVSGCDTNVKVDITGDNLEDVDVTVSLLGKTVPIVNGTAIIPLKAADIPTTETDPYEAIVTAYINGVEATFYRCEVIPLSPSIWTPIATFAAEPSPSEISIWFASGIEAAPKGMISKVDGVPYPNRVEGNMLYISSEGGAVPQLKEPKVVVVSGVVYPIQFPSFSFTFTVEIA